MTARDDAAIARVEVDLVSGRYFRLIAASNRSAPLSGAPIASRDWANMMLAIATYARMGDRAASTAAQIFGRVHQYLTPNEVVAQVADALAEVARSGWYDVRSASGPNPGHPSSHEHPTTLRDALWLALLMTEVEMSAGNIGHVAGPGWVLQRLVARENITVHQVYLPQVAKALVA